MSILKNKWQNYLGLKPLLVATLVLGGLALVAAGAVRASGEEAAAENASGNTATASEETSSPPVDGGTIYATFCALCHQTGLNGAPKYHDKYAWKPRIAQGRETLYNTTINGVRNMPPKGGRPELSDEEVKAAVDHIVAGSGGWQD